MYYELDRKDKLLSTCETTNKSLDEDLKYVMAQLGSEPDEFKDDLADLLEEFDTLIAINDDLGEEKTLLNDSLTKQRDRILQLQKLVASGNYNRRKAEKELEVLRGYMKVYARRVDSLISENDILKNRLTQTKQILEESEASNKKFRERTGQLEETVAAGQVLKTTNLSAEGIRLKSNGDQRASTRAKRVDRVKACFMLMENRIARSGTKTIYLRVIDPNAAIMGNPGGGTFDMNGTTGTYAVSRDIDYQNQDVDVCIYYIMDREAVKGTYQVEVWCEGARIGNTSFDLK